MLRKDAERRAKHAEASAEIEREAREKAEAEIEKLQRATEQGERAKAKPAPTKTVELLSGLLPAVSSMRSAPNKSAGKIDALWQEKGNRKHNETAQIDLAARSTDHAAA